MVGHCKYYSIRGSKNAVNNNNAVPGTRYTPGVPGTVNAAESRIGAGSRNFVAKSENSGYTSFSTSQSQGTVGKTA